MSWSWQWHVEYDKGVHTLKSSCIESSIIHHHPSITIIIHFPSSSILATLMCHRSAQGTSPTVHPVGSRILDSSKLNFFLFQLIADKENANSKHQHQKIKPANLVSYLVSFSCKTTFGFDYLTSFLNIMEVLKSSKPLPRNWWLVSLSVEEPTDYRAEESRFDQRHVCHVGRHLRRW